MKSRNQNKTLGFLPWPKLTRGTLIRRYKRFMADVKLRNNHTVTAHCPNTGRMLECAEPGRPVYLSRHNRPERRLKYTWEMIRMPASLVGVNTMIPNRLVRESILSGSVRELSDYVSVRSEVKYGKNSRIDLRLDSGDRPCFVEIKNCTLVTDGMAFFPDAVTARGLKHLIELQEQVRLGNRAVMFYLVQRMDAERFRPADHIDPAYGRELRKAVQNGVEIIAYDVVLNLEGIRLNKALPCEL